MPMNDTTYTAFAGEKKIASGSLEVVLTAAYHHARQERGEDTANLLFFRDDTGEQVDFALHGTLEESLERALPKQSQKGPGRPRMGVQCGEVCLMPRHWQWLERQPKRASATLRRLVEGAMKNMTPEERELERIEATQRFMWVTAGNRSGFEEAVRALYARRWDVFDAIIGLWPADIVDHIHTMLDPVRPGPAE